MKDQTAFETRAGSFGAWSGNVFRDANALDNGPHAIRTLVGEAGWGRLSSAVRERFGRAPEPGEVWHLSGVMGLVHCNGLGRLMAWVSRAIGTPVAYLTGHDVVTDVYVYADDRIGGTVWERRYKFSRHRTVIARTTKRIDRRGRMLECFGRGFGMELDVYEENAALHFRSMSFFIEIAGVRLRLPYLLSPGTLLVEHIDESRGTFRFRMTVTHSLFGRVFYQDGVFRQMEV